MYEIRGTWRYGQYGPIDFYGWRITVLHRSELVLSCYKAMCMSSKPLVSQNSVHQLHMPPHSAFQRCHHILPKIQSQLLPKMPQYIACHRCPPACPSQIPHTSHNSARTYPLHQFGLLVMCQMCGPHVCTSNTVADIFSDMSYTKGSKKSAVTNLQKLNVEIVFFGQRPKRFCTILLLHDILCYNMSYIIYYVILYYYFKKHSLN